MDAGVEGLGGDMMRGTCAVRVVCTACVSSDSRAQITAALDAEGVSLVGPDDADPRVASVIVFESRVDEAIDRVRALSIVCNERVLAVTTASSTGGLPRGSAYALIAAGAADVVSVTALSTITARLSRWAAIDGLLEGARTLVGTSAAWRRVMRQVVEVARFTDAPVLITGETGTGKELVSRLIHELDARPTKRDLVLVDCTTIVPELSGSELFGHEKGSFTGAVAARNGAFALADDGTLFLDEAGELPLVLQAELLRVVQEHTYKRVGGNVWQATKFRLVCATNRDLEAERDAGRFRADLYYRISGWTFQLPPLRERRDDILPLARHFLGDHPLDDAVAQYLVHRDYRGNIRELKQLCARIAHRHVGPGPYTIGDLGSDLRGELLIESGESWCDRSFHDSIGKAVALGVGLKDIGRIAEDIAVRCAVASENGSLQSAAKKLGVTDRALQMRRARGTDAPATTNGHGNGHSNGHGNGPSNGHANGNGRRE